jgi:hypothetical protein
LWIVHALNLISKKCVDKSVGITYVFIAGGG